MKKFTSATFVQVSKEAFDSANSYIDVKDICSVHTTRVILEDNKSSISFCNERADMIGFIKKEKKSYFLTFGPTKRIYPKSIRKDDIKILDGRYVTFHNI